MTETKTLTSIKDVQDAGENPEMFDWFVMQRGEMVKVKFYSDSCGLDERFWLFGREYGPELLVNTYGHESSAYEIFIDELPPIPQEDVHEAYNAFDRLLEYMESKGHENTAQLRGFCNRWCKFYFEVDTKDANNTGAWDRWELDESYRYQSNATGTGIVHVGHCEWMEELDPSKIFFSRKSS